MDAGNDETASFAIATGDTKSSADQSQDLALLSHNETAPNECCSTSDMDHVQMVEILEHYAFDTLCDECIYKQKNEIKEYFTIANMNGQTFTAMKARTFKNNIVNHCDGNIEMKEPLNKLYETIAQYPEFTRLQSKLKTNTDKQSRARRKSSCCYVSYKAAAFRVIDRDILPNKLSLKCAFASDHDENIQQRETEIEMAAHIELTTQQDTPQEDTVCRIEITSEPYNIQCDDIAITALSKGDKLSQIGFGNTDYNLDGLQANDVYKIIQYQPVPFTLSFQRTDAKCNPCCALSCCKSNTKKKETQSGKCTQRVLKWIIRFVKQGWPITSRASAVIDTVTDLILLYKASNSGVVLLTMVLFITLLPPYILSYSSGVQIFLYRKTFQNVQLFTFRSLLLGLYLFPTGIIYFILLDLMDVLAEVYKWIAYGIINKIKSEQELIQIESNIAEYFGMSRMDWISFKKQKLIAQLFFETVPQVILQLYLFLYSSEGRKLSGITDRDLILSIGSAVFNCFVQILRLAYESAAVHETFVQYALNCLTARYEWVPFKHELDRFVENQEDLLQINYKIQYRLPCITRLTEYMKRKNELEPLRIKYKHKQNRLLFGSVQYDFSQITINALISSIKNLSDRYQSNNKRISIIFGGSLRLLDLRSIISLMQCCKEKQIELPDITQIDWHQSFENAPNEQDIRLFSNTFDTDNKSLLISLYLTGYHAQNGYSLLKQFVRAHDVPINVADYNGDTILHHMIRRADYDGVYSVLFNLKPRQRFNFHSVNDNGDTIIHEMIQQNDYAELKHLLDIITLQSNGPLNNLGIFNNDGKSAIYLALEQDIITLKAHGKLQLDSMERQCQTDWLLQTLILERTMEPRKVSEMERWLVDEEYDTDAIADDVENERGSNLFVTLSSEMNHFHFIQSNMRMLGDLVLLLKEKNDNYDQIRLNQMDHQTIHNIIHLKLGLMAMRPIQNEEEYEQMKERVDISIQIPHKSDDVIDRDATNNDLGLRIESLDAEKVAEDIVAAKVAKQMEEKNKFNGEKSMHQLLIEKNPEIISSQIHSENHLEDIDAYWSEIIDALLEKDAQILSKEINLLYRLFVYIIRHKSDSIRYLETLHEIITKCQLLKICDKNGGNTPIHYIISSNMSSTACAPILSFLCETYPEWMMMRNKEGHLPLYLAIVNQNTNGFFTLCRFMVENKVNVRQILKEKVYIERMIEFGSRLLRDGSGAIVIQLLLSTFDYADLFQWTKKHNTFDSDIKSDDISLIKSVSRTGYKQTIDEILYHKCLLNKEIHDTELFTEREDLEEAKLEDPDLEVNLERKRKDPHNPEVDDEKEDEQDDLKEEEDGKATEEDEDDDAVYEGEEELESVAWIELAYSTLVETFSVLDLYTDIIILSQLYGTKNQWWTSWMLLLLICPYLVSHGSLVVTLKKKIDFESCCVGFGASLLMTPIALIYLFVIDIIFMIFALVSILWLFFTAIFTTICNCKYDANKVSKYDIREWIDDRIFKQWLDMNRTEIIAYRRLRTLSQLFFETMPQIVLQLRILWVIEWGAKGGNTSNNTFEIDINALGWSIGLALAHLLLESIFIYLDKCAFKMSFMEYALECLGGRVQWVPFQHLLENFIENQFYICNTNDECIATVDETNFDAQSYSIPLHDDHSQTRAVALNYEDIFADMQCFRYSVSYQFSSQSLNKLIEMIVNCPPMLVPIPFKLLSTTVPIQNIMKSLLCTAEIKIGNNTLSSIDIASVCKLYRACGEKKIDVTVTRDEMNVIQRLLRTDERNHSIRALVLEMARNEIEDHTFEADQVDDPSIVDQLQKKKSDVEIANAIKQTLKSCNESAVIEWITADISSESLSDVKLFIVSNALTSSGDLKLDILRRCYQKQFYVGLDCRVMNRIATVINDCAKKCEHDESWYLVIIFILLYSCGRVFGVKCINGCCRLSQSIQTALSLQWMPSCIKIGELEMAYRVFENCGIYRSHIEGLFGNICKNYIISRDTQQNTQEVVVAAHNKIMKRCKQWDQLKGQSAEYIKEMMQTLLHQFEGQEFDDENIALLDELLIELKMSSSYNKYLYQTLQYRESLTNRLDIELHANSITAIEWTQLITHDDFDQSERFQICEMLFTSDKNGAHLRIYFDENVTDINNKIFLWNMTTFSADGDEDEQHLAFMDTENPGLDRYNYDLLHSKEYPSLMVQSFDDCNITIDVVYTAMYRSTSHRRLDAIRAKIVLNAEKALEEITKLDVVGLYRFGRTLGSGASCRVVQATHKLDATDQVAIKIMDKDRAVVKKLFHREVTVLDALTPDVSQPPKGILPFMGYGEDDDSYYLVTRLLSGGELFDRIVSKDEKYKITEKVAIKLVGSMLETVKYCHDHNVIHRDLKPENFVFVNKAVDSDLVLIDFGCSQIVTDDEIVDNVVGTAYYLAPELAVAAIDNYRKKGVSVSEKIPAPEPRTGRILKAADVWAIGVIAYVMMTGRAPFRGKDNIGIFQSCVLKPVIFPEKDARYRNTLKLSDHFKDFIGQLLVKDPSKRMGVEEAIRHPWIQGVDASDYRLNRDVIHYLQQFSYQSKLKKEVTRVLAANMTEQPAQQVMKHFNRLDADGDGFLDVQELSWMLLDMGYPKHQASVEARKMIQHVDKNGDGVIDVEEFKQMWYRKVLTTNDAYIHRVFDVFDDNGDGVIDAKELALIVFPDDSEEGQQDIEIMQSIQGMIDEIDSNGDKVIDFDEFKNAMQEETDSGKLVFGGEQEAHGGFIGKKI